MQRVNWQANCLVPIGLMIQANCIVPCVTCMFCSNKPYWYEYHIDFTHVASANEMIRPAIMVTNIRSNRKYISTGLESQRNRICGKIWTSFENKDHLSMQWPSHYKGKMCMRLSFNSLGPSDAICRQISGSTLAQVMACCLTAPSHYLNQCWVTISKVPWHSPKDISIRSTADTRQRNKFENWIFKIASRFPRGQWVNDGNSHISDSIFFIETAPDDTSSCQSIQ